MRKNSTLWSLIVGASLVLQDSPVEAYPAFGKMMNPKLTQSCTSCHVVFPKLTLYGRTIREIGYQVPDYKAHESEIKAIYRAIPISVRGMIDIASDDPERQVTVKELQLISAGNTLKDRLSWWFHKHIVDDNTMVSITQGVPHESWLQVNVSDLLHVRAGMFEIPLWFMPSKTRASDIEYLFYNTTTNENNLGLLSSPQFGIQVNGHVREFLTYEDQWGESVGEDYAEGYNYALSLSNGESSFETRVTTFFGRFTRKTPRYSAGLYALLGRGETMGTESMAHSDENHDDPEREMATFTRFGADVDLYLGGDKKNLYASIGYGRDFDRSFVGGFGGYDLLIKSRLFVFLRYDIVRFISGQAGHHDAEGNGHNNDHGAHEEAHIHGDVVSENASSLSGGVYYMPFGNVRIGFDYRYALEGVDTRGSLQLQFGL